MSDLDAFRQHAQTWLMENCPPSRRRVHRDGEVVPKWGSPEFDAEAEVWRERMAAQGWTAPQWPKEHGGGGLSDDEAKVLAQEMGKLGCGSPVGGFGMFLLAPVLQEFANEDQKRRFLPGIASGEVAWCQGYSEPGAGSDLAGLQTSAVLDGDEYVIDGAKIWTTSAHLADWIFCLVRTDPDAPKHEGISFILFDMKSPGVTVQGIDLISGSSDFCQIFFDGVRAKACNLVGELGGGWTIAKRLLQHERTGLSGLMSAGASASAPKRSKKKGDGPVAPTSALAEAAAEYLGRDDDGRLADPALRDRIAQQEMDALCFGLTMGRSAAAARAGTGSSHAMSMSKLYASEMNKRREELMMSVMGASALGWEGDDDFTYQELAQARNWLRSKGNSIEGGTSEIQRNIIAKRVLGLPD